MFKKTTGQILQIKWNKADLFRYELRFGCTVRHKRRLGSQLKNISKVENVEKC